MGVTELVFELALQAKIKGVLMGQTVVMVATWQ